MMNDSHTGISFQQLRHCNDHSGIPLQLQTTVGAPLDDSRVAGGQLTK